MAKIVIRHVAGEISRMLAGEQAIDECIAGTKRSTVERRAERGGQYAFDGGRNVRGVVDPHGLGCVEQRHGQQVTGRGDDSQMATGCTRAHCTRRADPARHVRTRRGF